MAAIEQNIDLVSMAKMLRHFKLLCDKILQDPLYAQRLRNIFYQSTDRGRTVRQIFWGRLGIDLRPGEEQQLTKLLDAFFRKKSFRQNIPHGVRNQLLTKQNYGCAFCGCPVNEHDPVDHIVPFKYVGDELDENYQILCKHCNSQKNATIDYQIKILFELV